MSASSSSSSKAAHIALSRSSMMHTNAVYFPNFRVYKGDSPGELNYACINRVYYAFANVADDGSVFLSDEWADTQAPCDGVQGALGSLMHLKQRHPHLQVILSIGGSQSVETFPLVASDPLLRENLARSAYGLVEASGLDGIDIVWEYPCNDQQGADFLAVLAAMRTHFPEDQYILTAALPAAEVVLRCLDLAQCARFLDSINLTAYDFYGSWTSTTGHHAQLYGRRKGDVSGSSGVAYLIASGVPGRKILLGIPLFGRSFLQAAGPGQSYDGTGGEDGTFDYKDLPRKGTQEQVDKRAVAAQCIGGDGGFVTYDNPDTVATKAMFCKQKGLAGLFYWSGPADARDGKRSLIAAGFRTLHSS